MNSNMDSIIYKELSFKIVGIVMNVHKELGYGFLEKVYENAMIVLFRKEKINVQQQAPISVYFKDEMIGDYFADILIENKVILELKSVERIISKHWVQTLNYLKATGIKLAIILNFGKEKLEFERFVL
jgi:GxxExxY protein